MRKFLWIVVAASTLGALKAEEPEVVKPARQQAVVLVGPPPVTHILRRTAAEWLEHLRKYENQDERKLAMFCLADFGPAAVAAVPDLIAVAKDELQPENERWAAQTLGAMGPGAKESVPFLLSILNDSAKPGSHRAAACSALAAIDPENARARKAVLNALRDRSVEVRADAIDAVVPWAATDANALNGLARALQNEEDAAAAANALLCVGGPAIEVLDKALDRSGPETVKASANALGLLGGEGAVALPNLLKALKRERSEKVQAALVLAAARIAPKDPAVLEALVERLGLLDAQRKNETDAARETLTTETRVLAAAGVEALPALQKGLRSRDQHVRLDAVGVLARLPASGELVEALMLAVQDKDQAVQLAAAKALDALGPAAAQAKTVLEQVANGNAHSVEAEAAARLAAVNVARPANTPRHRLAFEVKSDRELLALLRAPDAQQRREAAEALRTHPDETGAIATALIETLDDADEAVRVAAGQSLLRFGKFSRVALPKFTQWLESGGVAQRKAALAALAGMGADAKPALPALITAAEAPGLDDDRQTQHYLSIVLRVIGPDAVPPLVNELQNADPAARARIARALGSMGMVGAPAIPDLLALARCAIDSDAKAGFGALEDIGPIAYPLAAEVLRGTIRASEFPDRRKWASYAAAGIKVPDEGDKVGVLDALLMALMDEDEGVCRAAHTALVRIGAPALPKLREMMALGEGEAPYWAVRVLARMKADPQDIIPRLVELTEPGKRPVERGTAAELLGEYAPAHPEMIPALLRVLGDREDYVARAAMRSLSAFGEQAIAPIRVLLRNGNTLLRRRALEALAKVRATIESGQTQPAAR